MLKKPQELVLLCFQTRSDLNYHKIYCTTRGEAVIYFGSQPKWKTRSQSLSSLCAGPKTPHRGKQGLGEPGCSTIIHSKKRKSMKANFKGELNMATPCDLLKVNMLSERQSSQKSQNRAEQFFSRALGPTHHLFTIDQLNLSCYLWNLSI